MMQEQPAMRLDANVNVRGRRCAITGTNGYLGSRLARAVEKEGWIVYRLTRQKSEAGESNQFSVPFSLSSGAPADFFKDESIDTLIHCAYDFRLTRWSDIYAQNVEGSVRLIQAAKAEGVKRIIYISSMSAFSGCKSLYGKAKLAVEEEAFRLGATVVRPGLIFGDEPGAMLGALNKAIKSSSIVPLIGSGKQVLYPAHEDDLASLVLRLCTEDNFCSGGPIIAASENGKTFRGILRTLAAINRRSIRLVPVPWRLCWVVLKAAEVCGMRIGFRSDSVISLVNQDPHPAFDLTRKMGVPFRDFAAKL